MTRLPRLAFGNSLALASAGDLADRLAEQDRARSIKLPDAPRDFRGHMAFLQVGELNLGAFAHSPVTVDAGDAPGHVVMIPLFGSLTFTSKESRFTARAGDSLALLTGMGNRVETSLDSHVVTLFDRDRLLRTSRGMLGLEDEAPIDLNLEQARAVSTSPAGQPMGSVFGSLFQIMDRLPSPNLAMLGLDDVFYRTLAVILSPQVASAFVNPEAGRRPPPTRPEISAVCDYILGHLEQPLGLTQLERVSGLSARSLQFAFRKQFQCSPMQWVRQARLGLGHRLLSAAKPGDRVTDIALSCGFTDFGAFSAAYRNQFGETPSETLRRALRRC
jgi:AraC-like DNA-binding protein